MRSTPFHQQHWLLCRATFWRELKSASKLTEGISSTCNWYILPFFIIASWARRFLRKQIGCILRAFAKCWGGVHIWQTWRLQSCVTLLFVDVTQTKNQCGNNMETTKIKVEGNLRNVELHKENRDFENVGYWSTFPITNMLDELRWKMNTLYWRSSSAISKRNRKGNHVRF